MLRDFAFDCRIRLLTGATTGKSLVSRRGLGRVRHIDVADLWIQQHVREGDFEVIKLKNTFNSSDMMTKHLGREDMERCVQNLSCTFQDGRSALAPQLNAIDGSGLDIMLFNMGIKCYHL